MGTIDAVRPMEPLGIAAPAGFTVRRATSDDAAALALLDVEHRRHYSEPPVFMAPRMPNDARAWAEFLEVPDSGAWVAEDAGGPFGFMQLGREFGGSSVVESVSGIFISGACVRSTHRGRGAATAILEAALRHHAGAGLTTCAVDFEAFNPEAAAFWLRHFTPVCHSLMRVPESPIG
jgi:GNAT superfamily N-acetyltransferase